jgi:hypothetical protein
MTDKQELLSRVRAVFDSWQKLLAGICEEEITAQPFPASWSIKDVIAHLTAWQQISVVRLEAPVLNKRPVFPTVLPGPIPSLRKTIPITLTPGSTSSPMTNHGRLCIALGRTATNASSIWQKRSPKRRCLTHNDTHG